MQPSSFGCLESLSSEQRQGSDVVAGPILHKTRDIHLDPFRNNVESSYRSRSQSRAYPLWCLAAISFMIICFSNFAEGLKCLDCVGKDCMGSFCTGDYCVLSHYAPRWGTVEWGEPQVVKGCMSGSLLRKDIRNHCEVAEDNGQEVFTCFCNNKNYCNGEASLEKLEEEPVQLLTCVCEGSHCKSPTCLGELCTFVVNHKTKQTEQGCVNASVPLVERRSSGACMIPPITGAMHHTVAKSADDLLSTESCICGSDYCNREKPEPDVPERMKCQTFVRFKVLGNKMVSRNVTCTGEYCFKAKITSKIGHMSEYSTIGCASFVDGAELAEELNPTGCAKFSSESVEVEACMETKDKRAIGRARANQQIPDRPTSKSTKSQKGKAKPKVEITYEEEDDQEDTIDDNASADDGIMESGGNMKDAKEEEDATQSGEEQQRRRGLPRTKSTTEQNYIFERPTLPPTPEDSNTALISVFLLIIMLIILSGAVWKLQLHKRLFRANYDTVAGG
ncbi:hypothetical protein Ddc_00570 [Ditylenchus destructor]|nr:hypothetical protein Ddc_00570 [Ditylenchus destructor]